MKGIPVKQRFTDSGFAASSTHFGKKLSDFIERNPELELVSF
jgi:hypothetical protein